MKKISERARVSEEMSGELKKLINQLSDANPERRAQAAYDLGEYADKGLRDESALPKLVKLLEDQNEEARENASYALVVYVEKGLVDKSALQKLVELLEDENEDVCGFAAYIIGSYALGGLTDETALPKLVKLLGDKNEEICENAASVLAVYAEKGLVSGESVYPLIKLLDNASEGVRKEAEWALDSIAKHYHVSREGLVEAARRGDFRQIMGKAETFLTTRGFIFKILMAGDGAAGKTMLIKQWIDGTFDSCYPMTIGPAFADKTLHIEGKPIKLQIWDFGGQPHWHEMRMACYNGAMGVMYVYDVSRMDTYDNIPRWYEEVAKVCGDIPRVLIANKVDLKDLREVTSDMGSVLAEKLGNIPYFETSAKTGQQVNEAFQKIAQLVYDWAKERRLDSVLIGTTETRKLPSIVLNLVMKKGIIAVDDIYTVKLYPPPTSGEVLACFKELTSKGLLLDGNKLVDPKWLQARIREAEGDSSKLKSTGVSQKLLKQVAKQLEEEKRFTLDKNVPNCNQSPNSEGSRRTRRHFQNRVLRADSTKRQ